MVDPGFLSGLIGWVIGFAMGIIVEQIKILLSFRVQLRKLEKQREIYTMVFGQHPTPPTALKKLFELFGDASEMVKLGGAVLPFDFISRYLLCKKITTLISRIDDEIITLHNLYVVMPLMKQAIPNDKISAEEKGAVHASEEKVVSTNSLPSSMQKFQYTSNPVVSATVDEGTSMLVVTPPAEEEKLAEEVQLLMQEVQEEATSTNGGSLCIDIQVTAAPTTMAAMATPAGEEELPTETAISAEEEMPVEAAISPEEMPEESVIYAEQEEEVEPENHGFFSRFMGMPLKWIVAQSKRENEGMKQLECLEDTVRRIGPTMTIIKERLNSTSDGNASVVEAWIKQLEKVLGNADEMNKQYQGRFISHRKARQRVSGLISEINALLKWGLVILSFENFIR